MAIFLILKNQYALRSLLVSEAFTARSVFFCTVFCGMLEMHCFYLYIYIYMHVYVCACLYVYT